eukprot:Skav210855  [mRNA]  locus=scaffold2829:239979:242584:- [translate_table: standard]
MVSFSLMVFFATVGATRMGREEQAGALHQSDADGGGCWGSVGACCTTKCEGEEDEYDLDHGSFSKCEVVKGKVYNPNSDGTYECKEKCTLLRKVRDAALPDLQEAWPFGGRDMRYKKIKQKTQTRYYPENVTVTRNGGGGERTKCWVTKDPKW